MCAHTASYIGLTWCCLFLFQYHDIDGRDPALFADANVRQLAVGGRGDPAAPSANVHRPRPAAQIRHRHGRAAQIPLPGVHELQRGALPQLPALLHRQPNGNVT